MTSTEQQKTKKKLIILASSISAVGHVNACSGALAPFLRRGHRVVFVVEEAYRGRLTALGFEEIVYQAPKAAEEGNPGEALSQRLKEYQVFGAHSVVEKFRSLVELLHDEQYFADLAAGDRTISRAIETLRPDLLWWDGGLLFPAVYYSGIPWVKNQSLTAICFLTSDQIPPSCSGYSSDADPKEVEAFNELRKSMLYSKRYNDMIEKTLGYERFPEDIGVPNSQLLTVYASPEELNFEYVRGLDRWFNLEVFNKGSAGCDDRDQLKQFVPESFLNKKLGGKYSGKIVYLSMGSMCSYDLELMGRFVSILGATPHKYIVSKGPRHEEFSLAENMWGDRYLPQTSILPHVDLVITHGGNNTTTEVFAQGKPMIVLPTFGDQFDNAQRLEETGFGKRIEYNFTADQLTSAIESLLNDDDLNARLRAASRRILSDNRHELLVETVEKLLFQESS